MTISVLICVGEQRPGGRASRVRTNVLSSVGELLAEVGYDELSVDAVAERAGVHKTTIYRRWPTKSALVTDAASTHSAQAVPQPDTGTLLGDLRALARSVVANIASEEGARRSRSLVAAAAGSDEVARAMGAFWAERFHLAAPIGERAIARGELAPGTDPDLVIETLIGPLWVRLLLTGQPVTDELADRVAKLVASGAVESTGERFQEGEGPNR